MKTNKRQSDIDYLRGLAVLGMILIHTNYYFLNNSVSLSLWNYAQFAVPVFIFCAGYLFFQKPFNLTLKNYLQYFKKRFLRLMIPYYIFLLIFIPLNHFKDPTRVTIDYIWQSIFLTGGVEINWLVLLFLQFALLFPLLAYLRQKQQLFFYTFILLAFINTSLFMFYVFPQNYKFLMWLPWSLLFLLGLFVLKFQERKWFYPLTLTVSGIVYALGYLQRLSINASPSFFDNKYPPNLYFIAFGIFSTILILFLVRKIVMPQTLSIFLQFMSTNSYSLYFIHYCVLNVALYALPKFPFTWYTFFPFVLIPSMLIQIGLNRLTRKSLF